MPLDYNSLILPASKIRSASMIWAFLNSDFEPYTRSAEFNPSWKNFLLAFCFWKPQRQATVFYCTFKVIQKLQWLQKFKPFSGCTQVGNTITWLFQFITEEEKEELLFGLWGSSVCALISFEAGRCCNYFLLFLHHELQNQFGGAFCAPGAKYASDSSFPYWQKMQWGHVVVGCTVIDKQSMNWLWTAAVSATTWRLFFFSIMAVDFADIN